jgi:hypothetical protein
MDGGCPLCQCQLQHANQNKLDASISFLVLRRPMKVHLLFTTRILSWCQRTVVLWASLSASIVLSFRPTGIVDRGNAQSRALTRWFLVARFRSRRRPPKWRRVPILLKSFYMGRHIYIVSPATGFQANVHYAHNSCYRLVVDEAVASVASPSFLRSL